MKSSLDIATASQDNHLRALVIALTSAHYVHTASDHAKMMLDTARQLASGMGAPVAKHGSTSQATSTEDSPAFGNVPLGLWVGERFYGELYMALFGLHIILNMFALFPELYLRKGDGEKAQNQHRVNEALRAAFRTLSSRGSKPHNKLLHNTGQTRS